MTQRLPAPVGDKISQYINELSRWGAQMNLVGSSDHDALRVHVADSLAAVEALPKGARVVETAKDGASS